MSEVTSLNLYTLDELVTQVREVLGIPITKDNLVHPAKDLDTTKMIYFAILREAGLADKIESNSAWNSGYRVHPDLPSDLENHPEVFQVWTMLQHPLYQCIHALRSTDISAYSDTLGDGQNCSHKRNVTNFYWVA